MTLNSAIPVCSIWMVHGGRHPRAWWVTSRRARAASRTSVPSDASSSVSNGQVQRLAIVRSHEDRQDHDSPMGSERVVRKSGSLMRQVYPADIHGRRHRKRMLPNGVDLEVVKKAISDEEEKTAQLLAVACNDRSLHRCELSW